MTNTQIAAGLVLVEQMERDARAEWDAMAKSDNGVEYLAAMGVTRQAGALKKALEQLIVSRATAAHRAATTR